jgi:hypothetical protein
VVDGIDGVGWKDAGDVGVDVSNLVGGDVVGGEAVRNFESG